jgi:hypothetical protein
MDRLQSFRKVGFSSQAKTWTLQLTYTIPLQVPLHRGPSTIWSTRISLPPISNATGAGDRIVDSAVDEPDGRAVIYLGVPVAHWQAGSWALHAERKSIAIPVSMISIVVLNVFIHVKYSTMVYAMSLP